MCGRFTDQHSWREIWEHYQAFLDSLNTNPGFNLPPRYNIAPTQNVLCVVERNHEAQFIDARWGLVPYWAKEPPKAPTINARGETAAERPLFRAAFRYRRCLIPADGYYEWQKTGKATQPYRLHLDESLFSFAGLWAENPHMAVTSCTILTLPAAGSHRPHSRPHAGDPGSRNLQRLDFRRNQFAGCGEAARAQPRAAIAILSRSAPSSIRTRMTGRSVFSRWSLPLDVRAGRVKTELPNRHDALLMNARPGLLHAFLLSAWLIASGSPALAADAAERAVHGFSPDGRYFAFEQYGVQDGSGFPYADVFIVDLEGDKWVEGTPIRVLLEDEGKTLGAARGEAMSRARPLLDRLAIGEPGIVLATNVIYQAGSDPRRMVFVPYYRSLGNLEPVSQEDDDVITLSLEEIVLPSPAGCPIDDTPKVGFCSEDGARARASPRKSFATRPFPPRGAARSPTAFPT